MILDMKIHIHYLQTPSRYIKAEEIRGEYVDSLRLTPSKTGYGFKDEKLICEWVNNILKARPNLKLMTSSCHDEELLFDQP